MVSNFSSIHYFSLLAFILFLVVPLSSSDNANYTACSTLYSCGNIRDVGYPFWGGNRPVFCGIPDFELKCDNNVSSFKLYQNALVRFSVHSINTSSKTIVFSLENVLKFCYSQRTSYLTKNPNLERNPLYRTIYLFYGCAKSCVSRNDSKSFMCLNYQDYGTNNNVTDAAYYFPKESDLIGSGKSSCSCKYNIPFPVDKSGYEELKSTNASLMTVLKKQLIENSYAASNFTVECSKCEESGGRCGSSGYQFVCYARYGNPPQTLTKKHGGRRKLLTILGSGAFALVLLSTMLVALIIRAHKRHSTNKFSFPWSRRVIEDRNVAVFLKSFGSLVPKRYTYGELRSMTNSFKEKLGEGGYGSVYKGRLSDDRLVAVKKLKVLKGDGKDFINEVLSISRTNHVNIVTLLGFCFEGKKRALVFEFLPNGSLEKFLYGTEPSHRLQWETMFNIAIGVARGLDYLHRGCNTRILHFDIKPHNILLDEDFNPKISDFGLARLCLPKNSMISMSEARGTIGYIAPEVFCRNFGGVSHKSDVYSYGMMLLDLVCGRLDNTTNEAQCSSEQYFPEWIYNRLEALEDVAIHGITVDDSKHELERRMILVSLWCIQTYPSNRPPMFKVFEMLEAPIESLQMPPKPNFPSPARSLNNSSL